MSGILIFFHNPSNSGFASRRHEITFAKMAYSLVGDYNKVHFAYTSLELGRSASLPKEVVNIIEFDSTTKNPDKLNAISDYIRKHNICIGFGFDQPVKRPAYKHMRNAGMKYIISYVGAPMSGINSGIKLLLKKLDVALTKYMPDHFIFQSEGMRKTATHGRGIPYSKTSVVLSGTDTELYKPAADTDWYAYEEFGIDRPRKIVFFSGNMQERKGVDVIIRTAAELVNIRKRTDVHFLLVGNRWGQEKPLIEIVKNTPAAEHISFGGYRSDVPQLLKSCYMGMIASTGWDSYPMSSVEMAATALPIIVSDIPGLRETITINETGFLFPAGNHIAAADIIVRLLDDSGLQIKMGAFARNRVLQYQTTEHQVIRLENTVRAIAFNVLSK